MCVKNLITHDTKKRNIITHHIHVLISLTDDGFDSSAKTYQILVL